MIKLGVGFLIGLVLYDLLKIFIRAFCKALVTAWKKIDDDQR